MTEAGKTSPPGPHDGTDCAVVLTHADPESLANTDQVEAFLAGVVAGLNMRQLMEPVVFDVGTAIAKLGGLPWKDEGGVTGIVVLSTSHVAIHTWPEKSAARVCVWSCRAFEPEWLGDYTRLCFAGTVTVYNTSYTLKPGV